MVRLKLNYSKTKHNKLAIIGYGGHGRVVADIALSLDIYDKIVFLDDNTEIINNNEKLPYIGTTDLIEKLSGVYDFVVAIGSSKIRKKVSDRLNECNAFLATLVHKSAVVGSHVTIGCGSVVTAGSVINAGATVGDSCIVNTSSSVDHDCNIGDYVHIAVGTHLCGTVSVGENTWVGAGSTVINNIDICSDCMIGAGAVVVKNIDKSGTYVGVPAKLKK